jgi:phosphohistidine phosphatase
VTEGGTPRGTLTLWLLRHAKAAAEPPRGGNDHERPLAPRGRRDAAALGLQLLELGFRPPERVVTSTAQRTVETAERVASKLGISLDKRPRLYYGSPEDVVDELRTLGEDERSVMVVGHNPATHALALELLDGDDATGHAALSAFPTCALAVFGVPASRWSDLETGTASLLGFYRPPY